MNYDSDKKKFKNSKNQQISKQRTMEDIQKEKVRKARWRKDEQKGS